MRPRNNQNRRISSVKTTNIGYLAKLYIIFISIGVALILVAARVIYGISSGASLVMCLAGLFCILAAFLFTPGMRHKKMVRKGLELEKNFPHDYKFVSHNAIFYINTDGKLGALWKNNPFEIQLADLRGLTDVRTNDGKMVGGTSLVRCMFKLDGKQYSIHTFRASGQQYSMKSTEVLEAISKADKCCEMLCNAKQAAMSGAN